ncbi:LamG-like jellyroll fold domain-containing protein [Haloferula sp.]|uniref:LamG-like jellyroll fold domain-containing protein n=1 Tax=Haloferula sp. TaxID=2497595 RepID=UPI003C7803F4
MNHKTLLLIACSSSLTSSILSAAPITWGAAQNVTGAVGEISTNGSSVGAWNVGNLTGAATVINGVSFEKWSPPAWTGGTATALNQNGSSAIDPSTTGNAAYDDLLRTARVPQGGDVGNPSQTGYIRLDTLVTLVPGQTYEIQIWFNDQKEPNNDRVITFGSASGPLTTLADGIVSGNPGPGASTVSLEADPNNIAGPSDAVFGQYAIGTFTADTDEFYLLAQGTHPTPETNLRPHLTGMQIRAIPVLAPIGHYWDFDTLDVATSLPIDRYGALVTTASGLPDISIDSTYGEAFVGAGKSLNTFTAGSDYLIAETHADTFATALDFGMNSFAISYWSYNDTRDENPNNAMVFDCVAGAAAGGLQLGTNANGIYNLRINDVDGNSVISNNVSGFGGVTQPADQWVHVTLNVDRTNNLLSIYFNGVAIPEGSISISSLTGKITCSQDLQLGARDGTTQLCGLDDFAIYPQILSAQQITALANATTTPLDVLASFEDSTGIPVVSTAFDGTTGEFTMIFTSTTGKTYSVFGGSDLADISSWPELTVSDITGDDTDLTYSHTPGGSRFFYQVRED